MKKNKYRKIILLLLLGYVILTRNIGKWGIFYSDHLYPCIGRCLSAFSGLFPFSIGDLFIILAISSVLLFPFYARWKKKMKWINIAAGEIEFLIWIYIWFYIAWGLNYYQPDFYRRTGIDKAACDSGYFKNFAFRYADSLNSNYSGNFTIEKETVKKECIKGYFQHADSLGIHKPFRENLKVKSMIYSNLAAKVGVSGSMAPFFCEFTVNRHVTALCYPSTYAHELSHLLGTANEAEANFYAYRICTASQNQEIRFSGYFSILSYLLNNARKILEPEDYKELFYRIRPEILDLLDQEIRYWRNRYSPFIGEIQNRLYEMYLKSNRIGSGQKNYSEVIGIIVSYDRRKKGNEKE